MTDQITEQPQERKTRGRSTAGMTAAAAANMRTATDSRVKFQRDNPRANGADGELNLSVPDGTIPEGYVGLWVLDDNKGGIQKKLAEWWGHVTDAQGVNISRNSGSGKVYLMAIEKKYKKEIDDLRESRYRASIGDNDRASLNVQGVESYTPNGETNKIKVTSDPFAS
jgi:hypothetical protein